MKKNDMKWDKKTRERPRQSINWVMRTELSPVGLKSCARVCSDAFSNSASCQHFVSLLSSQELTSQWNQGSARESLQTATVLCRVTAKVKLGSVFTACQVLLGQTGLPDNPRDAFLNYRVLSAPAGLREGHAPSLPCIPRGWQCRCCGPSSLDLGNDACLRHRTQGVSQPFRSNCCFNQYSSQTWMWHWGKIGIGYTRAGFETKGIQVMMLS